MTTLSKSEILKSLRDVSMLPSHASHRTVYETRDGDIAIDFAAYPGGTVNRVPLDLILELEKDGIVQRAFPDKRINAWILASEATR